MARTLSLVEARAQLMRLPEQLSDEAAMEAVTVTRRGKPVLAVLPWEMYESLVETLEILGDPDQSAALRAGIEDMERGEVQDLEDALAELGL